MSLVHGVDQRSDYVLFSNPALTAVLTVAQYGNKHPARRSISSVVWPSASTFGRYLCKHMGLVVGKTVLELGCGIGLTGLVAGALGASLVLLTDCEGVELVTANIEHNIPLHPDLLNARAATLCWGDGAAISALSIFDLVLASDCLYCVDNESVQTPLAQTVAALLAPDGVFLLMFELRGNWLVGPGVRVSTNTLTDTATV